MREERFRQYIDQSIDWAVHFLPNFFGAVIFLFIGWWIIGKVDKSIKIVMANKGFELSLTTFLRTLFSLGSKTILVIMVAGQIGFQTTSLAAIIGAVGLAIGLALQGSLANLAGGVLILVFKPYKVGDTITVSGYTGKVKEIQIFNTIMLLPDNKTIMLPNGTVSNGAIINNNKQPYLRFDVLVNFSNISKFDEIAEGIKDILYADELVMKTPPIQIHIAEMDNNKMLIVASVSCMPDDLEKAKINANKNLSRFFLQKEYNYSFTTKSY